MSDVLDMVFAERASWDIRNIYQKEDLEIYYEAIDHTTKQAPLEVTLLSIITQQDFALRGGQCSFVVIPKGQRYKNEWVQKIVGR